MLFTISRERLYCKTEIYNINKETYNVNKRTKQNVYKIAFHICSAYTL